MKNEHHVYSGMADTLKKWIISEFTSEKKFGEFVEYVDPNSHLDQEIEDLFNTLEL